MLVCVPSGSGSKRSFASGRRVFVLRDMSRCTGLVDIPVVGVFLKIKIANQGSLFAANDVRKIFFAIFTELSTMPFYCA